MINFWNGSRRSKYAAPHEIGEVKVIRGNMYDYLAMTLEYSLPGVLRVDMTKYVKSMIDDFPNQLEGVRNFHGQVNCSQFL